MFFEPPPFPSLKVETDSLEGTDFLPRGKVFKLMAKPRTVKFALLLMLRNRLTNYRQRRKRMLTDFSGKTKRKLPPPFSTDYLPIIRKFEKYMAESRKTICRRLQMQKTFNA